MNHDAKCERVWGGLSGWSPCYCYARPAEIRPTDAARVEADLNERRTNTRDRLNRLDRAGDGPFHRDAAINWLAWEHPDLLNEALDESGADQ